MANPKTTAQIAGHPLHPMLIPFPIAFFVATLACDLAYWWSGTNGWTTATLWLVGAGIIIALMAAVTGLTDFFGEPQIRSLNDAWWHAGGNIVVVLIQAGNWYIRFATGSASVLPTGIILSTVVVCILLFTGWKGWEMVYLGRVGVAEDPRSGPSRARTTTTRTAA